MTPDGKSVKMRRHAGEYIDCERCGTTVYKSRHDIETNGHHFCGRECYLEGSREIRNCTTCGEEIVRIKSYQSWKTFCSPDCRNTKVIRNCSVCATPVVRQPRDVALYRYTICPDVECRSVFMRMLRLKAKGKPYTKSTRSVFLPCFNCGTKVRRDARRRAQRKFPEVSCKKPECRRIFMNDYVLRNRPPRKFDPVTRKIIG